MTIKIEVDAFVKHVLDGIPLAATPTSSVSPPMMLAGFKAFPTSGAVSQSPAPEGRFAQLLLENAGFGPAPTLPLRDFLLGEQRTAHLLPKLVSYWAKADAQGRPFHILLFQIDIGARKLLADPFFRNRDTLEDALHRITQDALEGFARGGTERTADRKQGAQTETLCVVSVSDDRSDGPARQVVCFGTSCVATNSMEVFTLREEVRDWDRPLAEEHLEQLFKRHFRKLGDGAKWQEAFVSGPERAKAEALLEACRKPDLLGQHQNTLKDAVFTLLDQLALSFGVGRTKQYKGQPASLEMEDLPPDHSIAVDPTKARGKSNRLKGVRVFDSSDRLLGYIVYVVDQKEDLEKLRGELKAHNHFHNVLVVYPGEGGGTLELWQGPEPLRGRLTAAANRSRFDGVGGVVQLLSRFFVVSKSAIDKPEHLARELAWRAQHLKAIALDELKRELKAESGPLFDLFRDFNQALAHQEPEQFADTYAQTITYGMLAARWLAKDKLTRFTRKEAMKLLPSTSEFLRDLLNRLINNEYDTNLTWLLDDITTLLSRTLVREVFHGEQDPSIHFYQDFLDAYDPALRRRMGVYYTPDEVVEYIVRLLDHLARTRLGLRLGLADPIQWGEYAKQRGIDKPAGTKDTDLVVQILDPATGTGTFPLHALSLIYQTMTSEYDRLGLSDETAAAEWKKYVRESLLPRLNAFELMMAPYIVTHLRLGLALEEGLAEGRAARLGLEGAERHAMVDRWRFVFGKKDRLRVFLTNTLELHSKHQLDWLSPHVAEEAREAEKLKKETAVLVILGNPPYERVSADTDSASEWVLSGKVPGREGGKSLFDDILDVARQHTIFSHHASLYDRYVYFWRWALWKVFQYPESAGVVGFITNSSWLTGPGFVGLRQLARQLADEIWTVDLGGDNRGTNPEPNVFNIETPVAITAVCRATSSSSTDAPAASAYRKVDGYSGSEKLDKVADATHPNPLDGAWKSPSSSWLESLVPPTGGAEWVAFPSVAQLLPWQMPGVMWNRTWPISPSNGVLTQRWHRFVSSSVAERPALFVTAATGRNIGTKVGTLPRLSELKAESPHLPIVRFGLRAFDRQWAFEDPRLAALERPALRMTASDRQVFLVSLMTAELGKGPALVVSPYVVDKHYFNGRGGKDVIPLYRDPAATQPNITKGVLAQLASTLNIPLPTPDDFAAYVYALLSAFRYQERFAEALKTPGPRVPMTQDSALWSKAVSLGKQLLWLHTYTERFQDHAEGRVTALPTVPGLAWTSPVTQMPDKPSDLKYDEAKQQLKVGNGIVSSVRPDVMAYSVSGMKVVYKWLGYRTAKGAGKAASSSNPLDKLRLTSWPEEWNKELIELLTVLTVTLDMQPELATLLDAICEGPLISADELPKPTDAEREEPKVTKPSNTTLF